MLEISSVGAKVAYAVATTAGVRPTTGYIVIPDIKEAPDVDLTTETLNASTLADKITRYIAGRQDPGGEKAFNASNTAAFRSAWAGFVSAAQMALAGGKETYIAYIPPEGDDEAFFWAGIPQSLGHGGFQDNSVLVVAPKAVCAGVVGYFEKPSLATSPATYLVTFGVDDGVDGRVAGATITIGGKILTTDANGFAKTYLAAGSHSYTVKATGFTDKTDSVTVTNAAVLEEVTLAS